MVLIGAETDSIMCMGLRDGITGYYGFTTAFDLWDITVNKGVVENRVL